MEVDLQLNHLHMQVKYVMQDYTKCNPRSGYQASIFIITGYRTKLVGHTIPTDIAIMKI